MELRSKESGMGLTRYKLGDLIELEDVRNEHGEYTADDVRGVNNLKELIKTKANLVVETYRNFKSWNQAYSFLITAPHETEVE